MRSTAHEGSATETRTADLAAAASPSPAVTCAELLGRSPFVRRAAEQVRRAAAEKGHVLVLAERGLDLKSVARQVHAASPRASSPFLPIDCAGGNPEELEHLLFGSVNPHSARARSAGGIEAVHQRSPLVAAGTGTVFLANIDDLSAFAQARLARVVRDGEVRVRESGRSLRLAVRIVGGSHPMLQRDVEDGSFCADLYRRLSRLRVEVPPLRERAEDIEAIVSHLAQEICHAAGRPVRRFTQVAIALLTGLPWRGNTEELRALLERVLLARPDGDVRLEDILHHLRLDGGVGPAATGSLREARRRFEREYVVATLQTHRWRMSEAARALGIQRSNLYRKVQQLGIPRARLGD